MERGDKLNGPSLQAQSSAAISKLQADTQALNALKAAVSNFNAGAELKGTSISGMKQQLNDYLTVIDANITANDVDMEDFQTLSSTAGGEVIDGTAILDEWDSAKEGKAAAERAADNARGWASFFRIFNAETANILENNAKVYDAQADTWQEIITWCQEQADKFDQIKSATDGLFVTGPSMRETAASALVDITGAFRVNGYAPNMNAGWRTTINKKKQYIELIQNGIISVNENGEISVNLEELKKISANNITKQEYEQLCLVYEQLLKESDIASIEILRVISDYERNKIFVEDKELKRLCENFEPIPSRVEKYEVNAANRNDIIADTKATLEWRASNDIGNLMEKAIGEIPVVGDLYDTWKTQVANGTEETKKILEWADSIQIGNTVYVDERFFVPKSGNVQDAQIRVVTVQIRDENNNIVRQEQSISKSYY
ncbi:MAG: hypothetical protein PHX08_09175 [Lachnospiraceae bacterium]|nr:hypothetical protein [Lachnospiraceae bacterium]